MRIPLAPFAPVAAVAAIAVALAVALAGCSSPVPQEAGESAVQRESFPGVYAQTIEWGACDEAFGLDEQYIGRLEESGGSVEGFRCAMVEAPLDWSRPESHETIELAVVHVPATGDAPIGTLLGNPGGPGESGLEYTYDMTVAEGFDGIRERYDLLGFDPRGIGRSSPVVCDDASEGTVALFSTCAAEHPLARSMGTSQAARDMELLRHLMGDERMHYLGYSYGTMLGATYATLFPERVGRMVLDSAEAADWASLTGYFNQSLAIAEALVDLVTECGTVYEVEVCPLADEASLLDTLQRLAEDPLIASDGTEIGRELFEGYLVSALYKRTAGREIALDTAALALFGDQDAIDGIAAEMSGGGSALSWAGSIVRCHSFPDEPDVLELLDRIDETGLPPLLGGPELSDESLAQFTDLSCLALPGSGDDVTGSFSFSGSPDAPILVIGVRGDHATPYQGAEQLVEELGNARLLTLNAVGHIASYIGRSSCIDAATTAYLLKGALPAEGTICADD